MKKQSLLIAGPVNLDYGLTSDAVIGGQASYAALAATRIVHTQMWSRLGEDANNAIEYLEEKRIDVSGIALEGESNSYDFPKKKFTRAGASLPSLVPSDPSDLGVTLTLGLSLEETKIATNALSDLKDSDKRINITVLSADLAVDEIFTVLGATNILILRNSHLVSDQGELLKKTELITKSENNEVTTVLLPAGFFGGIIRYKNKICTWPVSPREQIDKTGITSIFAGTLAAAICEHGKLDYRGLKKCTALASAVAGGTGTKIAMKKISSLDRSDYQRLYNTNKRNCKH